MKKKSAVLAFALKVLVSLGLLSFFLSRLDLSRFLEAVSSSHLSYLVLALFAYLLGKLITSLRWALLARPLGFSNPLRDFVTFYYIGMFFNLFSPSTLGGDVGRVFYLSRNGSENRHKGRTENAAFALVSILADRGVGMAVLVWFGAAALVAFPEYALLVPEVVRYVTYALALGPLVGWLLFPFCRRFIERFDHPVGKKLRLLAECYWDNQPVLLRGILLSLAFHLIQIWIQVLIGRALDLDIPWSYALVFFPLVDIVSMLPVTFSGIGLREGGYLFFLGRLSVSPEKAVACGSLWLAMLIVSGLVGGVVFVLHRGSTRWPLEQTGPRRN